jgi:hypothetical protein
VAGGQHQLVGGASLEMCRGRKIDYLDIPLKDSIKGWRLEWFIVENHENSLHPRSGRQPDVRTPSWTESPTDLEVAEAGALLAEVGLLKERGLTAEAVVADFIFKHIQPLKDRAYPAYLYRGLADSTWVTNRRIPALVASLGEIPDDERQVYFEVPLNPSDAEISAMLDMLAEDSSDAAPAETLAVAPIPEAGKALDIQRSDSVCPKHPRRANQPTSLAEGKKKKKRRLRRVSCLDQDVDPSAPAAEEVLVPVFAEAEPNGCDPTDADPNGCDLDDAKPNGCNLATADPNGCTVCIIDEDEEEENKVPLIQKNSRRYIASGESSGVGAKAKTLPFARCLRLSRCANGDDDRQSSLFVQHAEGRRPMARSPHPTASPNTGARVQSGPS